MTDGSRGLFDKQLEDLRSSIVELTSLVGTAIEHAIKALKDQDTELAHQVVESDGEINDKRFDIEEQCLTLIATQQPAARDLRAIVAAIHLATELERMGDYAAGIAEIAVNLAKLPELKPLIDLPRMADIDQEMIRTSLDAYLNEDAELALATAKRDAEIDQLYDQIYRELLTYMLEDPRNIARATQLLWVSHNLERIADRVSNICERVIFMTSGKFTEFNY